MTDCLCTGVEIYLWKFVLVCVHLCTFRLKEFVSLFLRTTPTSIWSWNSSMVANSSPLSGGKANSSKSPTPVSTPLGNAEPRVTELISARKAHAKGILCAFDFKAILSSLFPALILPVLVRHLRKTTRWQQSIKQPPPLLLPMSLNALSCLALIALFITRSLITTV